MKVHVLIPCVGEPYSDYLDRALSRWLPSAASVTIVTAPSDDQTSLVAVKHGCIVHHTDIWWMNGAYFNKAGALEQARTQTMPSGDWRIFADADVEPPEDWLVQIESQRPQSGYLYGAHRVMDDGHVKNDAGELPGFFLLYQADDPLAKPSLGNWKSAGSYDSAFQARWGDKRVKLPLILRHYGPDGKNWCGAGRSDLMDELRQERKRRGGWRHEQIM